MMHRKVGLLIFISSAVIFPATAMAAPPPAGVTPPSWAGPGTQQQGQAPKPTNTAPPSNTTAPNTTQPTQPTQPRTSTSCHRHHNHSYSCVVRNADTNAVIKTCKGHGKITAARKNACRQKALRSLGFLKTGPTAKAANKVPASYNPPGMLCDRQPDANPNGDFYVFSPYIEPRDTTQNGWVGIANVAYWWDGSQWVYWLTTPPQFHYKPSDIFEQATDVHKFDWYDANMNESSGDWRFTAPKGVWTMVLTYYFWAPQNGFPNVDYDVLPAHQDPAGVDARGTLCQVGLDNYGD